MEINLKEIRKELGMSQQQLADALSVDKKSVGNWERGTTEPSLAMACRICNALECTPNDLCGISRETITRSEQMLIDAYRACTPERKRALDMIARDFAGVSQTSAQSSRCANEGIGVG